MSNVWSTPRPTWEEYFLSLARAVATRADCTRRQVGAVIVKDHRVMATGYNGAPPGADGCLTKGACPRGAAGFDAIPPGSSYDTGVGSCIAIHAEQNAVMYASYDQRQGATIYITDVPCDGCLKMLSGSGIDQIVTPVASYSRKDVFEKYFKHLDRSSYSVVGGFWLRYKSLVSPEIAKVAR